MGRSRAGSRRPAAGSLEDPQKPAASLVSATLARVWQGVGYRPLPDAAESRALFDFAAIPWPQGKRIELAWGAYRSLGGAEELAGALVGERAETSLLLHGPVVVSGDDPVEIAAQLVAAALDHARALGVETVFVRPGGLDRVWVRFGFIPIPEGALPAGLAGRPGAGLYAWRGGTALWTFRETAAGGL